ncbi:hypothetical protein D9M69_507550 [compost metagenome]
MNEARTRLVPLQVVVHGVLQQVGVQHPDWNFTAGFRLAVLPLAIWVALAQPRRVGLAATLDQHELAMQAAALQLAVEVIGLLGHTSLTTRVADHQGWQHGPAASIGERISLLHHVGDQDLPVLKVGGWIDRQLVSIRADATAVPNVVAIDQPFFAADTIPVDLHHEARLATGLNVHGGDQKPDALGHLVLDHLFATPNEHVSRSHRLGALRHVRRALVEVGSAQQLGFVARGDVGVHAFQVAQTDRLPALEGGRHTAQPEAGDFALPSDAAYFAMPVHLLALDEPDA